MNINGRESYILAKALYMAAEILRAQKDAPNSDIETMISLLDRFFSSYKNLFKVQADLKKALARGMPPELIQSVASVTEWLKDHPDDNVVVNLFHDPVVE